MPTNKGKKKRSTSKKGITVKRNPKETAEDYLWRVVISKYDKQGVNRMGTTEQLTGLFPTIVAGGIALKFTEAALGKRKRTSRPKSRRGKRLSNKFGPF